MLSIFSKLKQALTKTSDRVSSGLENIFLKKKLDSETLESLQDLLISADIGSSVVSVLIEDIKKLKFDKEVSVDEVKNQLVHSISKIIDSTTKPFTLKDSGLNIILVCGVNGNGKTTTIGKLAAMYQKQGKKVAVAACDTFRAAAVEQLEQWASIINIKVFKGLAKADPSSVAYNAVKQSISDNTDILLIDTAGRLHNHTNLMQELAKIVKTIKKIDEHAPHQVMLVIDATVGQNAYNQVKEFKDCVEVSSLVITKLDGTAKAGVIVGIVQKFDVPVHFIGIGERIDDIGFFETTAFIKALIGAK